MPAVAHQTSHSLAGILMPDCQFDRELCLRSQSSPIKHSTPNNQLISIVCYTRQPSRTLHSTSQHLLQIPLLVTNFGQHSFSCASAETWNTSQVESKTHLPSPHLKLALNPTCLTWSKNTRHDCLLSIW